MRAVRSITYACALMLLAFASSTSAASSVTVEISGFAFRPEMLTITAGDTVTWTNRDAALHSVVFLTGLGQTENFGLGQSSSLRFITAGTYQYICGLHGQSMSGTVIVRPSDGPVEVGGTAPTFVPPTATPLSTGGAAVRGADQAPVLPDSALPSDIDPARAAVYAGIGVLGFYLVARGASLLRRK